MSVSVTSTVDTGDDIKAIDTIRRGVAVSPELRDGLWGTFALAVLATARPGRHPDRRAADPRPRAQRPRRSRCPVHARDGTGGHDRDRDHRRRVVLHDQPPLHHRRDRPRLAADQGLPPRPRPAGPHPEHRAPRRPGLPGHLRRRPGQPVPGLRRHPLRGQRAPDRRRHRDHAVLLLAADPGRLALLPAAVRVAALLPAPALRRLRHRPPPGRHHAVGDLRARRGCRGGPLVRRGGAHPGAHRHRDPRAPGGQHRVPRASPRSRSRSVASPVVSPTRAC